MLNYFQVLTIFKKDDKKEIYICLTRTNIGLQNIYILKNIKQHKTFKCLGVTGNCPLFQNIKLIIFLEND